MSYNQRTLVFVFVHYAGHGLDLNSSSLRFANSRGKSFSVSQAFFNQVRLVNEESDLLPSTILKVDIMFIYLILDIVTLPGEQLLNQSIKVLAVYTIHSVHVWTLMRV